MARRVFFSFHFRDDCMRAAQVRNMGTFEDDKVAYDNGWQSVKSRDDTTIKRWIGAQMDGRTCAVVLIGELTASRPWVQYEIREAWHRGMGLVGIHIHGLNDPVTGFARKGPNPFVIEVDGKRLSPLVQPHDPVGLRGAYAIIKSSLEEWIDEAIAFRQKWGEIRRLF